MTLLCCKDAIEMMRCLLMPFLTQILWVSVKISLLRHSSTVLQKKFELFLVRVDAKKKYIWLRHFSGRIAESRFFVFLISWILRKIVWRPLPWQLCPVRQTTSRTRSMPPSSRCNLEWLQSETIKKSWPTVPHLRPRPRKTPEDANDYYDAF